MASDLQKILLSTVLRQNRNDTTSPTNAFNLNSTAVQAYLTQKLKGILPNATGNITENELMTAWLLANSGVGSGTVTSVDITTNAGAITITGNPITTAGAIDLDFNGANTDYIDGEGNAQPFPTIPSGTVTNVAALTLGTSGTDLSSTVANPTTTPVITLNVPTASALNRGALSAADWAVFNNKQDKSIVINSNTTAVLDGVYTVVASATFTDPTPAEGKGFMVFVRNGTATVGGTGYSTAGTIINRIFHSGAWANYTSSSFTPSALTKTDDTNVTLTLGGTPATALLQAASITAGWTGTLAIARGGTGGTLYGGWDLISTATASSSATIDFTGLSSTYYKYVLVISNAVVATNNTAFWLRVGTGATPTYQSGASDYGWSRVFGAAGVVGNTNTTADTKILIGSNGNQSNSATRSFNCDVSIFNPSQTTDYHPISYVGGYIDSSAAYVYQSGYGTYQSTTAITAIRILSSSGNIASGTFKLYGIR